MNLKLQLKILSFLQFCLWGSWLTTLGSYMFVTLKFDGASIGAVYSSLGIAAVFMPTLLGIVADKWLSAKWVYALCHVVGAITLFMAAEVTTPGAMFFVILLNSLAYMPTLGLINTISYYRLQSAGMDIVTDFPPIRIWGTIGFILAMWGVSFSGFELSHMQLISARRFPFCWYCLPLPCRTFRWRTNRKTRAGHQCWALTLLRCLKTSGWRFSSSSP